MFAESTYHVYQPKQYQLFVTEEASIQRIIYNNTPLLLTGVNLCWFFIAKGYCYILSSSSFSSDLEGNVVIGRENITVEDLKFQRISIVHQCMCFLSWLVCSTLWHYKLHECSFFTDYLKCFCVMKYIVWELLILWF